VLADAGRGDLVLCQITSNPYADPLAVELSQAAFFTGSLHRTSYARPGKLFTASETIIVGRAGTLQSAVLDKIIEQVVRLLRGSRN
jgi:mRNA interferase MazF